MNHSRSPLLVIPILLVASVLALNSHGQDAPQPSKRAEFMRLKLDFSKKSSRGSSPRTSTRSSTARGS